MNKRAPLRFYSELYVNASPEAVWNLFSNVATWSTWSPICLECRLAGRDQLEPGCTLQMRLKILGFTFKVQADVIAVNPPTQITWRGQKLGITSIHTYRFQPREGGAMMSNEETFYGPGFFSRSLLAAWFAASQLSQGSLQGLQRRLEQDAPA